MRKKIAWVFLLFYLSLFSISGNIQLTDSAKVSLLTNSPWSGAVYTLFGHTAIRINDPQNQLDIVFNYGLFDFGAPNFLGRFIKGETDYSVGNTSFVRYIDSYSVNGVGITEQILNLSKTEKQHVFDALVVNSEPENRVYRYNYFYDNCSTRPRNIIENSILGTVKYTEPDSDINKTYRDLIHECVEMEPWVKFGIDLVIGSDADKPIDLRKRQFLPIYLKNSFSKAKIENPDHTTRKLVISKQQLTTPKIKQKQNRTFVTPISLGCIILICAIFISFNNLKKNKAHTIGRIFDFILFFTAGLCGCIIFFLMYFSVHPCTNPNWNLVWLNPITFLFSFFFLRKSILKYTYCYHFVNFAILLIFLLILPLAWFLHVPQYFEIAFLPYIFCLWIRSGANAIMLKKNKQRFNLGNA